METYLDDAQAWLDEMVVNLSEADPDATVFDTALIQEYIDAFAKGATWPDRARNTLIQAINREGGVYLFTSPDDGRPCISTASKLQQMLQSPTQGKALDAVNARLLY